LLAPSAIAEHLGEIIEREFRKIGGVRRQDLGIARPIEIRRLDLLRAFAVEKSEIRLGHLTRVVTIDILVDQRHRRLSPNRHAG